MIEYIGQKSLDDFIEDRQCQDAVIRRFEIMGEAVRRISEETRKLFPQIPWDRMRKLRNEMIHEYDSVDYYFVWDVIKKDISKWIVALEKILTEH